MKSNHKFYDFEKSRERVDDILTTTDSNFEELDSIPSRDRLTYTNGFYVYCTSLFIDIRKSSKLPNNYYRPTLARIFRSYISEVVAVINGNSHCNEINIEGDCIWGIFDTKYKSDINSVFSTSAKISSIIDVLNCKYEDNGIDPISVGIGLDYGRALMIKAGYNGSGINEVVWMGDVVNEASKLCSYGNNGWGDREFMLSEIFYNNLNDHNQSLLDWNPNRNCWHGNIYNVGMNDWINENCN